MLKKSNKITAKIETWRQRRRGMQSERAITSVRTAYLPDSGIPWRCTGSAARTERAATCILPTPRSVAPWRLRRGRHGGGGSGVGLEAGWASQILGSSWPSARTNENSGFSFPACVRNGLLWFEADGLLAFPAVA